MGVTLCTSSPPGLLASCRMILRSLPSPWWLLSRPLLYPELGVNLPTRLPPGVAVSKSKPELLSTAVSQADPDLLRVALTDANPDLLEVALTKAKAELLGTALTRGVRGELLRVALTQSRRTLWPLPSLLLTLTFSLPPLQSQAPNSLAPLSLTLM